MSSTLYGIVLDGEGRYVMAGVRHGRTGWRVRPSGRWRRSGVRGELLMGKGVLLGLRTHWNTGEPRAGEIGAEAKDGGMSARAFEAEIGTHTEALKRNLVGVVSEDAMLATLPLHAMGAPDSFLSAMQTATSYAVGVVVDRDLKFVVHMAPATRDALPCHLARIRRHLSRHYGSLPSPMPVYVLGGELPAGDGEFGYHQVTVDGGGRALTLEQMRAAGVALAALEPDLICLAGPSAESAVRTVRTGMYATAAATALATAIAFGAVSARYHTVSVRESKRRQAYEQAVAGSSETRQFLEENRELAERILSLRASFARQTRWAALLALLGEKRSNGLALDMLGSEPVSGDSSRVRIALAGTAARETDATDFIAMLQKVEYLSAISLSALERDREGSSIRFRMVCTLRLYDS